MGIPPLPPLPTYALEVQSPVRLEPDKPAARLRPYYK